MPGSAAAELPLQTAVAARPATEAERLRSILKETLRELEAIRALLR
jgi:hypothetical protein